MYSRIVVALDGSELAERVLPHVQALGEKFGATLILLRATSETPLIFPSLPGPMMGAPMGGSMSTYNAELAEEAEDAEAKETTEYLRQLSQRLAAEGLNVETDQPHGPAAEVILGRAQELKADLIAMTTHGRTGLARIFMGSVSEEVIRRTNCPVLLVRVVEPEDDSAS